MPFDYSQPNGRIRVEGLAELRRSLKAIDRDAERELRQQLRIAASTIVVAAGIYSPEGAPARDPHPGLLAASFRIGFGAGRNGEQIFIRNRLPYAGVTEWGGTIRPRGAPIRISRHRMLGRAIHEHLEPVVDRLGDAIDRIARKHGFH